VTPTEHTINGIYGTIGNTMKPPYTTITAMTSQGNDQVVVVATIPSWPRWAFTTPVSRR
jgi:hypothetical protein